MLEADLVQELNALLGWNAYPIKIPQNAKFPATVYREISNRRNDESSLSDNNLRDMRYEITVVSPDSEEAILAKGKLIEKFEGFSGAIGATNIFISRIESSVPTFDNAQQNFEYNVTIKFTESK